MNGTIPIATGMIAAISLVSLPACSDLGRPIDEQTLVSVIVDLHILEARRELVADTHETLRDSILAAHGMTSDDLYEAIRYYTDRPDEYVSIYNRVIDSLSAEEAELEESGVIDILPTP